MRICYEMCRTTTATTTASRIDVPSSNWRTPTHTYMHTHTHYTIHLHTRIHTHTQTHTDANVFLYWTFQIKMENANANRECESECSCWMANWTANRIRTRRKRRRDEYILKRNDKEWKNKRYIDLFSIDITTYDKQKTKHSFYFVNGRKAIVDAGTGVSYLWLYSPCCIVRLCLL